MPILNPDCKVLRIYSYNRISEKTHCTSRFSPCLQNRILSASVCNCLFNVRDRVRYKKNRINIIIIDGWIWACLYTLQAFLPHLLCDCQALFTRFLEEYAIKCDVSQKADTTKNSTNLLLMFEHLFYIMSLSLPKDTPLCGSFFSRLNSFP